MKKSLGLALFIILVIVGAVYVGVKLANAGQTKPGATVTPGGKSMPFTPAPFVPAPTDLLQPQTVGYQDISYEINGEPVQLKNGLSEVESAPGSSVKIVTRIFGNQAFGDLNGDNKDDVAFLLTQSTGGSGTFFYVAVALKTDFGYAGTNGILLGDRIAPQSTIIENGTVVVNYADRKPDEPFTTPPSVGMTKTLKVSHGSLLEVIAQSGLTGKQWVWISTLMNDGSSLSPKKTGRFTISFSSDGKVSGTTDCNSYGGNYTLDGDQITFSEFVHTLMACDGSQESEFLSSLEQVDRFTYDQTNNQLNLQLKYDSGVMIFH